MTIQRTLSKSRSRALLALERQKQELEAAFRESTEAQTELVELYRRELGLPEGQYQLKLEGEGQITLVLLPTEEGAPQLDEVEAGHPELP